MRYTISGEDYARLSFLKALEKESFPLRPGREGFADTARAENPFSGKSFNGFEALFLKAAARERGFKSSEFISFSEAESLKRGKGRIIEGGSRLTVVSFREEGISKEGGLVFRTRRFVNLSQLSSPERIREKSRVFKEKEIRERGTCGQFRAQSLFCVSTDPAAVLGLYFAALQTGRPFKISLAQYQDWSRKTRNFLSRESRSIDFSPDKGREKIKSGPSPFAKFAAAAIRTCAEVAAVLKSPNPSLALGMAALNLGSRALACETVKNPSRSR